MAGIMDKVATAAALKKMGQSVPWSTEPEEPSYSEKAPDISAPATATQPSENFMAGDYETEERLRREPPLGSVAAMEAPAPKPTPAPVAEEKNYSEAPAETAPAPVAESAPVAEKPATEPPASIAKSAFDLLMQDDEPAAPAPAAEPTPEPPASIATKSVTEPPAAPATQAAPGVTVVVQQPGAAKPAAKAAPAAKPAPAAPVASAPPPATPQSADDKLLAAATPTDRNRDGIEDVAFNPGDSSRSLQTQVAMHSARGGELRGERGDIQQELLDKQKTIEADRSKLAGEALVKAETTEAERDARWEEMRGQYETEMAALKQKMGAPPRSTVEMLLSAAAAVAGIRGNTAGANALNAFGAKIAEGPLRRWQGEVEGGKAKLDGMGKLINMDRLANQDETTQQEAIAKAYQTEMSAAFDAAKAQATTADQVAQLDILQNDFNQKVKAAELATRARREQARLDARALQAAQLAGGDTEAQAKVRLAFGKSGEKAINTVTATDQKSAALDKSRVDTARVRALTPAEVAVKQAQAKLAAAKAGAAEGGEVVPVGAGPIAGWTFTEPLTKGMTETISRAAMAQAARQRDLQRLKDYAIQVREGKINLADPTSEATANMVKDVARIRKSYVGKESQATGLGAPSGHEFETVLEGIADPTQLFRVSNVEYLLDRAMIDNHESFGNSMRSIKGIPNDEYAAILKTGGGARRTPSAGLVDMVGPDGKPAKFSASQLKAAEDAGFTMADPEDTE